MKPIRIFAFGETVPAAVAVDVMAPAATVAAAATEDDLMKFRRFVFIISNVLKKGRMEIAIKTSSSRNLAAEINPTYKLDARASASVNFRGNALACAASLYFRCFH